MVSENKIDTADLKDLAVALGADLVGIAPAWGLEGEAGGLPGISRYSGEAKSVIVLGKKMFMGTLRSKDLDTKQQNGGLLLMRLEEIAARLADQLEQLGHSAIVVPTAHVDFDSEAPEKYCPAGQGSPLLRAAAIKAGLGSLGINTMLLTKRFGPRIYLGGLLTDIECESEQEAAEELCPGLEKCGNCAAVCPEDAIPRRAPLGSPVSACSGLDAKACLKSSQPFGLDAFLDHFAEILRTKDEAEVEKLIRSRTTCEIWQNMTTINHGAYAGCMECWHVCPVGDDFARLSESGARKKDLPDGVARNIADGVVTVDNVGPQVRRSKSW